VVRSGYAVRMNDPLSIQHPAPPINEVYPRSTEEELKEAQDTLDRYLALIVRIYERVEADPTAYAQFKTLTASRRVTRLERSKVESFEQP
jgi:hypothetical protein